jgi:hypothetical protein
LREVWVVGHVEGDSGAVDVQDVDVVTLARGLLPPSVPGPELAAVAVVNRVLKFG